MTDEVLRVFIAVDISPQLRQALTDLMADLKTQLSHVPLRWSPPENIHLTLKFLGEVSRRNLRHIQDVLRAEALLYPPFEFSAGTLGAFPNEHHPRVVWVGVEGPKVLYRLQESLERALGRLGYPPDNRPFKPHLTLARIARTARPEDIRALSLVLRRTSVGYLGSTHVDTIHLYRSVLTPSGAVYTKLFSEPLRGGQGVAVV